MRPGLLARISLCLFGITGTLTGLVGAATLYGSGFNGPDGLATLHTIDPSTGSPTAVGPIGFQRVGSMDFGPDGRLYGVGERNDGSNRVVLIVIDTATGAGTEVAPLSGLTASRAVTDISFRPSDGKLYAFLDTPDQVATIDRSSGAVTVLGPSGTTGGGNGLVFTRNLILYLAEETKLFRVNQGSGVAALDGTMTHIGFPTLFGPRINSMDTEPATGRIFASLNDGIGGGGPTYLAILDPATVTVTNIGVTLGSLDGLTWEPDHCPVALYGASHPGAFTPSDFVSINPRTGAATTIGFIGFNAVTGIDVHPLTGTVYGVGLRPADATPVLITINPLTGAGLEVGPLGPALFPPLFDLSFRSDGTLYLVAFDSSQNDLGVYVVNESTGTASLLGFTLTSGDGNGIGHSLANILYHSDHASGGTLNIINQTTGLAALQGTLSYIGFPVLSQPEVPAIDIDPSTGAGWAIVNDTLNGSKYVATLDTRAGVARHIGSGILGLSALTWAPLCADGDPCTLDECVRCDDADLFGAVFAGPDGLSDLIQIDPVTGEPSVVGSIGFERVSGMDYDRETGVLYATGERPGGSNTSVLIAIDPATGAGNEIGPTGLPLGGSDAVSDISIRHSDGTIYAYLEPGDDVATIDRLTGAATLLGPSGLSGADDGAAFSNGDTLYHANDATVSTLDQSTGAGTAGPAVSFAGFPPPAGTYRIAAMETSCDGHFIAAVKDGPFGTAYLGALDPATGVVSNIGVSEPLLDALAWTGVRSFCRSTFQDTDLDERCDAQDCAAADASAWAFPPEITDDTFLTSNYTWGSVAAVSGPGTVYDIVGNFAGSLPMGPFDFSFACKSPHQPIAVLSPPPGAILWVVVRARNACGIGTYGNEHRNDLPPVPRTTMNCP